MPTAAALAALLLAACATEDAGDTQPEDVGPPPAEDLGGDRDLGEEVIDEETGYSVKEIGQWVAVTMEEDVAAVFRIQDVDLELECTADGAQQPENDRFIGLQIELETSEQMEELGQAQFPMAAEDFQVMLADGGITGGLRGTGAECLPEDERMVEAVGPGEEASGTVVLDVPADVEAIVLDGVRYAVAAGWMWPLEGSAQ